MPEPPAPAAPAAPAYACDRPPFAAIVLSGGTGRRLGGIDKGTIVWRGRTLLAHVLASLHGADRIVVVGPPQPTDLPVIFTLEEPALGGPVAGVYAGLDALLDSYTHQPPPSVALVAVDMPRCTVETWERLLIAAGGPSAADSAGRVDRPDGAMLVDAEGRRALAGMLSVSGLSRIRPASPAGKSLYAVLAGLQLIDVPAVGDETRDIDTWGDLDN